MIVTTAVVNIEASEPKAKEPLIVILMVLLILTVVQFILLQICKILESISAELGPK